MDDMIQLSAVLIAFLLIPVLGKLKFRLSYTMLISALLLGVISGIGAKSIFESVLAVFTQESSLNTILTVLMVSVLGGLMKHYNILNKIVDSIMLVIPDKRIILMIIPAMIGILIIPGGALLSAPFIYSLGEEMKIPNQRRAAINLVFRHIPMFLMPYSTGLLVISATMPGINISRLIFLNLFYIVPSVIVGYFLYIKGLRKEKIHVSKANLGRNLFNVALYTLPIYICVIFNAITGWPFYITMISSIIATYFLSSKDDFLKTIVKSINWHTVLMVAAVLILKEIILQMEDLLIIFNSLFNSNSSMIYIMFIFLISSVFFGLVTGNQAASLAIILPMISQLSVSEDMIYIYLYFSYNCAFLGYFFSPIHLCQAFTVQHMNITTLELYKEYKYYIPMTIVVLFGSALLMSIFVG